MNGITSPPLTYDFGYNFNYSHWDANTEITMTNVPWNNDYRDVVRFPSREKMNEWIDKQPGNKTMTGLYAKVNQPITIDLPFNVAYRYNYIRAYNPAQPIPGEDVGREFYYFILDVQYIAPNTTRLVLQLDVWSTFIHDVQIGRCYIERGHIGIANMHAFQNYGRDFLAIPEGFDLGGEYVNVASRQFDVMSNAPSGSNGFGRSYNVLVVSTVELSREPGDKNSPQLWSAMGSSFQGLPSGASFYIWPTATDFQAFLRDYSDKPWVTQGIISVTAIPAIERYYSGHNKAKSRIGAYANLPTGPGDAVRHEMFQNWRDSHEILDYIPPRYRELKKFLTYPYMIIELTTWSGAPIILKPEIWNNANAAVREMAAFVPPGQRITFSPYDYNSRNPSSPYATKWYDGGEFLDMATMIANFPTFAVVNNQAINYLASNANSIAFGFRSTDWSQQKALRGNQVGYDNARAGIMAGVQSTTAGMASDQASTAVGNRVSREQTQLGQISGVLGGSALGIGGGLLAGGPAAAAVGGIGGALSGISSAITSGLANDISVNGANDMLAIRNASAIQQQNIQTGLGVQISDSNKGLADWAARGDYENQIAGMKAKLQDAQMTQPSVSGQFGGEAFNLIHNLVGLTARWKMVDQATISSIGEHWLRYGYAVNRSTFIPDDFAVMDHFSYWKLSETYIRASRVPEGFKQAIRGIFEKGFTVWRNPDEIGMIDPAENKPLQGIRLDVYDPPVIEPLPDPKPVKPNRRKKKMLVYKTTDAVDTFALAGSSPGQPANWIETESSQLAQAWLDATGQTAPVPLTVAQFSDYRAMYLAPVVTVDGAI